MKFNYEIKTREDFVKFVYNLFQDYHDNPQTWHNNNLELFLQGIAGWVDDMDGYYHNIGKEMPEKPDWQMVANMFMAAKVYE